MEADDKGEEMMKRKVLICENGMLIKYDESTVNWYLDCLNSANNVVAIVENDGHLEAFKVIGDGKVNEDVEVTKFASALVELGGQHE